MIKNTSFFHKKLIQWYLQNKRDLPWRGVSDPYFIWLSEIILQQTRVNQGLPYYLKFIRTFPTVEVLAAASEDQVLKLWQGLGYYSRARNLHVTAKYIANELGGVFPKTFEGLLSLKGVGDYTASAIASICYDAPTAVVDGNVYRVLTRVFGIHTPINSTQGIKEFKELAQHLIPTQNPGDYNQAIMEFGARYCIPQNPDCPNCIFKNTCIAYAENKVDELPVKIKKTKIRKRYFNYIVVLSEDRKTILKQRTKKGIWQKLYEFPLIESPSEISLEELQKTEDYKNLTCNYNIEAISLFNEASVIHKLSHQHLFTRFWIVEVINLPVISAETKENGTAIDKVRNYAVPVLIENFISEFSEFN